MLSSSEKILLGANTISRHTISIEILFTFGLGIIATTCARGDRLNLGLRRRECGNSFLRRVVSRSFFNGTLSVLIS
jgi:hypothetical protein